MGRVKAARPEGELARGAAVRDIVAGAALLGLGVLVGGTALDGQGDSLDYVFDVLGVLWLGWGVGRLASARARAGGRGGRDEPLSF